MSRIDRVEIHEFSFTVPNFGTEQTSAGVSNMIYQAGSQLEARRYAVQIACDDGLQGEYVTHWVGTPSSLAQAHMLAPLLLGRDPDQREQIYDDLKCAIRAYDHMGHGPLDNALWDLAGKKYGTSVSALLGGFRTRLPTYASTYHAQEAPGGLDTPEAFADFAQKCQERGFAGFKIHGWLNGDSDREIANLHGIRARIGGQMKLMLDPACQLRTWNDALRVGRACDEVGCFWYEDPYRDAAVSAYGHQRLRDKLDTPLLVSEHVRGLEQKASFMLAGGCDMIHADPEYDMGITGVMKIAHFCEGLGLDLQLHACGPAHRAALSAIRNTHLYEMALMGPGMINMVPPVYTCGYSDQPEDLGADGCVPVPDGPGLGVVYDWDFIAAHRTDHRIFED
ncbi:MAG: mandelate racemase [Candidatus Latescibacteria bacterium]|nr:mandelate racemase [Candidatus Latescibacterota bacterium]